MGTSSVIVPRNARPSYQQGYARNASESANPGLWKGLVGLWAPSLGPTGLTLRDISGYGNHGTLTNFADIGAAWRLGDPRSGGYGLQFEGDLRDEFILLERTISVSVFTLLANVYITDYDDDRTIFSSVASNSWSLRPTSVRIIAGGDAETSSAAAVVPSGEWHQAALTKSGVNIEYWVDGTLRGTDAFESDVTFSMDRIGINNISDEFDGAMSQASVYNRVLSPSEIYDHYVRPNDHLTLRPRVFPAAVAAAVGTVNPLVMGSINLLHGKLAG